MTAAARDRNVGRFGLSTLLRVRSPTQTPLRTFVTSSSPSSIPTSNTTPSRGRCRSDPDCTLPLLHERSLLPVCFEHTSRHSSALLSTSTLALLSIQSCLTYTCRVPRVSAAFSLSPPLSSSSTAIRRRSILLLQPLSSIAAAERDFHPLLLLPLLLLSTPPAHRNSHFFALISTTTIDYCMRRRV
ncbi:hypothetical protein GY45DRAFT_452003 [Cubamyces sp. BRFM 1775]|nr:hypothetical protein GY45DRAFT_452003 [Cubamyces sp. BRFM 1775]